MESYTGYRTPNIDYDYDYEQISFNTKFTQYCGEKVHGSVVKSLVNQTVASNNSNINHQVKIFSIKENYEVFEFKKDNVKNGEFYNIEAFSYDKDGFITFILITKDEQDINHNKIINKIENSNNINQGIQKELLQSWKEYKEEYEEKLQSSQEYEKRINKIEIIKILELIFWIIIILMFLIKLILKRKESEKVTVVRNIILGIICYIISYIKIFKFYSDIDYGYHGYSKLNINLNIISLLLIFAVIIDYFIQLYKKKYKIKILDVIIFLLINVIIITYYF